MELVKTTLLLRKDVHQQLVTMFGKRKVSEGVNELLFKELIMSGKKSLFGVTRGAKPFDREHHDRF
jgi:hypothetical protein